MSASTMMEEISARVDEVLSDLRLDLMMQKPKVVVQFHQEKWTAGGGFDMDQPATWNLARPDFWQPAQYGTTVNAAFGAFVGLDGGFRHCVDQGGDTVLIFHANALHGPNATRTGTFNGAKCLEDDKMRAWKFIQVFEAALAEKLERFHHVGPWVTMY